MANRSKIISLYIDVPFVRNGAKQHRSGGRKEERRLKEEETKHTANLATTLLSAVSL